MVCSLVCDECLTGGIFLVVSPFVCAEVHPKVEVSVGAVSTPASFLHCLEEAMCGFVDLLPHEFVVRDYGLFGFSSRNGNKGV